MKVQQVKKFINASYRSGKPTLDNYSLNTKLSGKRVQVYHDPTTNKTIVTHRGTKLSSPQDLWTDAKMIAGYERGKRFTHAAKIQKKAEQLYGAENITTIGHSLGGRIAEKVGNKSAKIITYNKAATPKSILKSIPSKQSDIRASGDVVSYLSKFQRRQKPILTAPGASFDKLKNHSTSKLKYIKNKSTE